MTSILNLKEYVDSNGRMESSTFVGTRSVTGLRIAWAIEQFTQTDQNPKL